ncbi:amino acid adenylation domain-containing protein [Roseiflexus sp.]|uniref:amino acid adenylation domain-containing protein n=1 Tax=Roseiflexus sp. TaxID=2562120 RepID=UPI00398B1A19
MSMQNVEDLYPLSPMQQGMLFHTLYAPGSGVYIEQLCFRICGDFDTAAFERAWSRVVERHTILRTAFVFGGLKEPAQVVHRVVDLPIRHFDWRRDPSATLPARLDAYCEADRLEGFTMIDPPLMRVSLLQTADHEWYVVWTYHHALLDGWSTPLVLREVLACYAAFVEGRSSVLPPTRPYRSYIAWLRRQDLLAAERFWRNYLAGFAAPTPFGIERTDASDRAIYRSVQVIWTAEATASLSDLARRHGLTLNTFIQGAWALLLGFYSGQDDVVFGATVAGRPPELPGIEEIPGLFINTLPVRVRIDPDRAVIAWLVEIQARQIVVRQFEYTPLFQIQSWSEIPRGEPLFESLLVFENYPVAEALKESHSALDIELVRSVEQTNYPLTLAVGVGDQMVLHILYDANRFDDAAIQRMVVHLQTILHGFVADPLRPLASVPILTAGEYAQLAAWRATDAPFPQEPFHRRFERVAGQRAEAIAIVTDDTAITYAEANRRANRLAHYLRKRGVGPETLVAICAERSIDQIIAVLAVFKAGGAYLPLDPTYPLERLLFMIDDAQPTLALIVRSASGAPENREASGVEQLRASIADRLPLTALPDAWDDLIDEPVTDLEGGAGLDNLAYVIYTSGSTGKPKGVLVEHRGLANLTEAVQDECAITPESRVLRFFSFGFDGSVAEIAMALAGGATLVVAPHETIADPMALVAFLRRQRVTTTIITPSLLAALPDDDLPDLRVVIVGGERCPVDVAHRWGPGRRFVNAYGPTEATVEVSFYLDTGVLPDIGSVPIGRPLANVHLFVLDRYRRLLPVGVPGELCIGGIHLARGYLNRPELTAERFVEWPADEQGCPVPDAVNVAAHRTVRLYRTGDLVRWLPDGNLEFLGRIDDQVKIRGYRVEPGEVEAVLCGHPAVCAAAVVARAEAPGDVRLVAYLVPETGSGKNDALVSQLRSFLRASLPEYMIPSAFVLLDELPLNVNGKIDRGALQARSAPMLTQRAVIAPRDDLERELVAIWQDVLATEPVGIHDNFFELGGHSLSAVRLATHIERRLGRRIDLATLFRFPTVEQLAHELRRESGAASAALVLLHNGDAQPPFFWIHPSGGSVHWYVELARHMPTRRPFYGIQARGIDGKEPLHTSIEAMATYYADAMLSVGSDGPFLIGGWSLGVILAYATAVELERRGKRVALLALLDQGPGVPGDEPVDTAAYLESVFGGHVPVTAAQLRDLEYADQVRLVFDEGRRIGWILPDVTPEQFTLFVDLLRTHTGAWRRYTPPPYTGRITLIRAAVQHPGDTPPATGNRLQRALERLTADLTVRFDRSAGRVLTANDGDMGWGHLASGGVDVFEVPGDHISMLHPPHVQVLARRLEACITTALATELQRARAQGR